jgi:hypothetical protein
VISQEGLSYMKLVSTLSCPVLRLHRKLIPQNNFINNIALIVILLDTKTLIGFQIQFSSLNVAISANFKIHFIKPPAQQCFLGPRILHALHVLHPAQHKL